MPEMVKKAVESLYNGVCSISEYREYKDDNSSITKFQEVIVYENIPCRLSYKTNDSSVQSRAVNYTSQKILLFIQNDINIKEGSKISVTQNNITCEYQNSGKPAIYKTHQEIILKLFNGFA